MAKPLLYFFLIVLVTSCVPGTAEEQAVRDSFLAIQAANRDQLSDLNRELRNLPEYRKWVAADSVRAVKMVAVCNLVEARLDSCYQYLFAGSGFNTEESEMLPIRSGFQKNSLSKGIFKRLQHDLTLFETLRAGSTASGSLGKPPYSTASGSGPFTARLANETKPSLFTIGHLAVQLNDMIEATEKNLMLYRPTAETGKIRPWASAIADVVTAGEPFRAVAILTTLHEGYKPVEWKVQPGPEEYTYQVTNGKVKVFKQHGPYIELAFDADAFPVTGLAGPNLEKRQIKVTGTTPFAAAIGTDPAYAWYGPPPANVAYSHSFDYHVDTSCK